MECHETSPRERHPSTPHGTEALLLTMRREEDSRYQNLPDSRQLCCSAKHSSAATYHLIQALPRPGAVGWSGKHALGREAYSLQVEPPNEKRPSTIQSGRTLSDRDLLQFPRSSGVRQFA